MLIAESNFLEEVHCWNIVGLSVDYEDSATCFGHDVSELAKEFGGDALAVEGRVGTQPEEPAVGPGGFVFLYGGSEGEADEAFIDFCDEAVFGVGLESGYDFVFVPGSVEVRELPCGEELFPEVKDSWNVVDFHGSDFHIGLLQTSSTFAFHTKHPYY